jgi:polyribonucleotide nucleotidyltransferase
MKITKKTLEIGGRTLTLEVGRFAEQASAAVLASYGETTVIATVVASPLKEDIGYFPLGVEYVERLYAGGRIKGSRWVKREGRPTDDAVLSGRLIDRSIRPLFPKGYSAQVQVIVTILSVDGENEPDIVAMNAVSAALAISNIPWNGPIGAIRVGFVPQKESEQSHFLLNPTETESAFCDMDLVVSTTKDNILMIEAGARETPEDVMLQALATAKAEGKKIVQMINELAEVVGKEKVSFVSNLPADELLTKLKAGYKKEIAALLEGQVAKENASSNAPLIEEIFAKYEEKFDKKSIEKALDMLVKKKIREDIINDEKRPDGRKIDEVRQISADVGLLPRTHGSAVFQRGQTQVLTVATLGAPSMQQLIESPMGEESKRYIHHYNFPPYSVGEAGRVGFVSRREIGHGALAERALMGVLPSEEVFPYTIRLVSEVMSSNGSTSMASTCGSTLALMDAGVPITRPVSGIAMGLMTMGDKFKVLTDIIGLEDFSGDMDFKVAGTTVGITAIQLDVKLGGLSDEMIKEAITRARKARLGILDKMLEVLPSSRPNLSQYAPKVILTKVPQEKIGEVIGPGGKVIRQIMAATGTTLDMEDDGTVTITGTTQEGVDRAKTWVESLVREVQVGEEFDGEVKRIVTFGAFVEILPGKEGLVHVSQMAEGFVKDPNELVKLGDKVKVRVMEIDDMHRINLTMKMNGPLPVSTDRPPQHHGRTFDRPRRPFRR